jgi:hypothetical protein
LQVLKASDVEVDKKSKTRTKKWEITLKM